MTRYTKNDVLLAAISLINDDARGVARKLGRFNILSYAKTFDFVTAKERAKLVMALERAWQWGQSVTPKKTLHDQRKKAENMRRATGLSTFSEF